MIKTAKIIKYDILSAITSKIHLGIYNECGIGKKLLFCSNNNGCPASKFFEMPFICFYIHTLHLYVHGTTKIKIGLKALVNIVVDRLKKN